MKTFLAVALMAAAEAQAQDCELTTFAGGVTIAAADMPAGDATCCANLKTIANFLLCREDTSAKGLCPLAFATCPDGATCTTTPSGYGAYVPGATALPLMGARCTGPAPDACVTAATTAFGANPGLAAVGNIWAGMCVTNPHTAEMDTCETTCPGFIDLVHGSHDANLCDSTTMSSCITDTAECQTSLETMKNSGGWPHFNARVFAGRCSMNGPGGDLCGAVVDEAMWDLQGPSSPAVSTAAAWGTACGANTGCDVSALSAAEKTAFCESAPVWGGHCAMHMATQLNLMKEATDTGNYTEEETMLQDALVAHAPQAIAACESVTTTEAPTTTTETPATTEATTTAASSATEAPVESTTTAEPDNASTAATSLAAVVALARFL